MTDLVVISLEAWDDVWRRNQHLVSRLLEGDPALRVLFVEPPADPLHDLVSRRRPARGLAPAPAPGFDGRLLRFRAVKALPRRIDRRADERLARAVERAAAAVGMRHPLLWVNDPDGAAVARLTGWPTLYDITDDWAAAERPTAEIARIRDDEAWLLGHARAVVACSPELVHRKSGTRAGSITLIPNAVDVEAYRAARPRPADLPPHAAVYVGTLHTDRLDLDVCEATARALGTEGRLVLVGPDALDDAAAQRLRAAGALLLGPRTRDDVIGYLQHADVLVVPHVVTPFTESLDPIKLYEYTAVGRPVIATAVAGFRDAADPDVRVVAASDFPGAVAGALAQPTSSPGRTKPPVASWDERATAMRAVIDALAPA